MEVFDIFLALSSIASLLVSIKFYITTKKEEEQLSRQKRKILQDFSYLATAYQNAVHNKIGGLSADMSSYEHPLPFKKIEDILLDVPKSSPSNTPIKVEDYINIIDIPLKKTSSQKNSDMGNNNLIEV